MKQKNFTALLLLGVALAVSLAFAGGWLIANLVRAAHPPDFSIVNDLTDEIPLIRFTSFDGRVLTGNYEGGQPRFLLGEQEELIVPEADGTFRLNLGEVR